MRLVSIEGNTQLLDGGAMYGNCPRAVWQKWSPPDDRNRIRLACRALLVTLDDGRHVLLEAGIGVFFDPKMRDRFGVDETEHVLLRSLEAAGVPHTEIDCVILSHLHFDHAGGLLSAWEANKPFELLFPKATFVVGKEAWDRAKDPHPRDRASFIPDLVSLLERSGRLELVTGASTKALPETIFSFSFSHGHTPGLMLTTALTPRGPITFVADLAPGAPWVHLPITMGYDRFPEKLIEEKRDVFDRTIAKNGWLYFTHDPAVCIARVVAKDGRYQTKDEAKELRD